MRMINRKKRVYGLLPQHLPHQLCYIAPMIYKSHLPAVLSGRCQPRDIACVFVVVAVEGFGVREVVDLPVGVARGHGGDDDGGVEGSEEVCGGEEVGELRMDGFSGVGVGCEAGCCVVEGVGGGGWIGGSSGRTVLAAVVGGVVEGCAAVVVAEGYDDEVAWFEGGGDGVEAPFTREGAGRAAGEGFVDDRDCEGLV